MLKRDIAGPVFSIADEMEICCIKRFMMERKDKTSKEVNPYGNL